MSTDPRYRLEPGGRLAGTITVPGDKSISHRALMLGAVAEGRTSISGFLASADCLATLDALRALGVSIERTGEHDVVVHGVGMQGLHAPSAPLDMGNAGTAMRLFMGLLAARPFDVTLVGDGSLMRRPMERVAAPLREMGATIVTHEGRPPVELRKGAELRAIDYALPVASAQVKSAVLLAALRASGVTRIVEPAPTRDHTERMLAAFGVDVRQDAREVTLEGGAQLTGTAIDVPADFSSAAFFLVAGALAAPQGLTLRKVGVNPTRTGLLHLLRSMGADIETRAERWIGQGAGSRGEPVADLHVRASELHGIEVPESLVPLAIDELPVFFIAAACAKGDTIVRGAQELRVKESDRLATMAEGLGRLGIEHELRPDGIAIRGRGAFDGGVIDSHGDHRIAMSFAVASLRARAPIEVRDVANVATSFPGFVALASEAGLRIRSV